MGKSTEEKEKEGKEDKVLERLTSCRQQCEGSSSEVDDSDLSSEEEEEEEEIVLEKLPELYELDLTELKILSKKIKHDKIDLTDDKTEAPERLEDIIEVREKKYFHIIELYSPSCSLIEHINKLAEICEAFADRQTEQETNNQPQANNNFEPHIVEILKRKDFPAIILVLEKWLDYATKMKKEYPYNRKDKEDDYYNDFSPTGERAKHKESQKFNSDFDGAENEIRAILNCLKNEPRSYFYLVAKKNGEIQGLLQQVEPLGNYISNIAIAPRNIKPDEGEKQVSGTLKVLLKKCIKMNLELKQEPVEIELVALSHRVKKIYDHYGFRVKGEPPIQRPKVDRGAFNWRTARGKKETDEIKEEDSSWYHNSKMTISINNQTAFVSDKYK